MAETSAVDVVTAVFTAVGGVAGGVGAIAAWRSAKASLEVGRDASEALALAITPTVDGGVTNSSDGTTVQTGVLVTNRSAFDATKIEVEVQRRDGQTVTRYVDRLVGASPLASPASPFVDVGLEFGDDAYEVVNELFIRYSDSRNIGRYQFHESYRERPNPNPSSWRPQEDRNVRLR